MILPGIEITAITPPKVGWPIIGHCPICKSTEIVLSPQPVKPKDRDIWLVCRICLDPDLGMRHNLEMYHASAGTRP